MRGSRERRRGGRYTVEGGAVERGGGGGRYTVEGGATERWGEGGGVDIQWREGQQREGGRGGG